jgi:hypothetical protein
VAEWRRDQEQSLGDIGQHQDADQSYLEEGVEFLELARNAQRLFAKQEAKEKRRPLGSLASNCSWKGGELTAELRQRFELLRETVAACQTEKATEPAFDGLNESACGPGQAYSIQRIGKRPRPSRALRDACRGMVPLRVDVSNSLRLAGPSLPHGSPWDIM